MWPTLAGSIVIPVGLVAPDVVMVQLLENAPAMVYLNTLSTVELSTTHSDVPSVTMSVEFLLYLVQRETRRSVLAAGSPAGRAGVLVDFVGIGVDHPHVRAIGGDALDRGLRVQAAERPRAQQAASGVVDVHLLVGVHHPDLVARDRARRAARSGVARVERIRLGQRGVQPVLERLVHRRVVHHVELRGLRVAEVEPRHLLAVGERYGVRAITAGKCLGKAWLDNFAHRVRSGIEPCERVVAERVGGRGLHNVKDVHRAGIHCTGVIPGKPQ